MILYFNNPYDRVSVNTLQSLFINDVYPSVIARTNAEDDKGLWISFLPTVILCSDQYVEYARIEDWKKITPDNMKWLEQHREDFANGVVPTDIPDGIIVKGVV